MKKNEAPRKLQIWRETLRQLESPALGPVRGAGNTAIETGATSERTCHGESISCPI